VFLTQSKRFRFHLMVRLPAYFICKSNEAQQPMLRLVWILAFSPSLLLLVMHPTRT